MRIYWCMELLTSVGPVKASCNKPFHGHFFSRFGLRHIRREIKECIREGREKNKGMQL